MPIPIYGDVNKFYDRMFPNGPQGTTDAEKAKQAKLLAQQTSAIEAAYARFKNVSSRSSALDKARLDAHAQALRDLEARLALAQASPARRPTRPRSPPAPSSTPWLVKRASRSRPTPTC